MKMVIGVFECDHVAPDLRGIAGDYRDMFPALFLPLAPDWEFRFFDVVTGEFPAGTGVCDAWMCTGSRFSVNDDAVWIAELKDFIRQLHTGKRGFAGVCFGHQLLAAALGGVVQTAGWCVGVHPFTMVEKADFMEPFQKEVNLLMMCQDQVVQLPPDGHLLARAADCPVGMFGVGDHMLGIQAHPEFPKAYNKALIELRKDRIGERKAAAGIAGLTAGTDERLVAGWIVQFLRNSVI